MSEPATALVVQDTALTHQEKQALQERQLKAIREILTSKTPPLEIRKRKGRGGVEYKYTDGAYVIRTLNTALAHNWDFETDNEEIVSWNGQPFEVRCRGRLTLRMGGQSVTKMQYGSQIIEFIKERDKDGKVYVVAPVSIGDCFKGAATDAMKKCASLFGLALDLYDSDYKAENYEEGEEREGLAAERGPQDGKGRSLASLVTPNQLVMITGMAKDLGVDLEKECLRQFQCSARELSKRSASTLIDYLKAKSPTRLTETEARANAGLSPVTVDAALGGAYDDIGDFLSIAGMEDASGARRYVYDLLVKGNIGKAAEYLKQDVELITDKFGHLYKAPAAPSRKAVFDRKHSPEVGKRLDAATARLVAYGVKGDELLRETNSALHDSEMKQVATRYELDDRGASLVSAMFEKWADSLDRAAKKDTGI